MIGCETFLSEDGTQSYRYKKRQQEGKTNRNILVEFDWSKQTAIYRNWDDTRPPLKLNGPTVDPLSILFAVRQFDLKQGEIYRLPTTDGKKLVDSQFSVIKTEKIKVPAGKIKCLLLEPDLKDLGGVFKKSKDAKMQIWLDAENLHPVKMKSKVVVGSFRAELKKSKQGK